MEDIDNRTIGTDIHEFFKIIVEPAFVLMKQELENRYHKDVEINIEPLKITAVGAKHGYASLTIYPKRSPIEKIKEVFSDVRLDEEWRYLIEIEILGDNNITINSTYYLKSYNGDKFSPSGKFYNITDYNNLSPKDIVDDIKQGLSWVVQQLWL